jgi:hypothetical protein
MSRSASLPEFDVIPGASLSVGKLKELADGKRCVTRAESLSANRITSVAAKTPQAAVSPIARVRGRSPFASSGSTVSASPSQTGSSSERATKKRSSAGARGSKRIISLEVESFSAAMTLPFFRTRRTGLFERATKRRNQSNQIGSTRSPFSCANAISCSIGRSSSREYSCSGSGSFFGCMPWSAQTRSRHARAVLRVTLATPKRS